jgi:agmatine/peptidylarginine deiminase
MAWVRKNRALKKDRSQKSPKFRYETFEDRIAPGSMLYMIGIAGVGSSQEIQNAAPQSAGEHWSYSLSRTPAMQSTSSGLSISPSLKIQFANTDILDNDRFEFRGESARELENRTGDVSRRIPSMKTSWKGMSRDGLVEHRLRDESFLAAAGLNFIDRSTPDRLSEGMAKVRLSSSPYQFGVQTAGTATIAPASPTETAVGVNSFSFTAQANFRASSYYLLSAGAENSELAGIFQANFVDDFQHRLPPELRGRSDDLSAGQSLFPFAIESSYQWREPTTGYVHSPPEYDPMRGVLFSYASFGSIVTDMVKELTSNPANDEIAYVVVTSETQRNTATNSFINAGADISKVQFFVQPMNSVWMRDYGPHFITVDDALAIVDSHYYPTRPLDNFIPTLVGVNNFKVPTYDMGLYFSGGNFQPGPNRSGFVTTLVNSDNPSADGFDAALILELHQRYLGIDTLHVLPRLPSSVDGTGHIDMWMYLLDQDTVVISEFLPGSNSTAIQVTNNAVAYMENLGFEVFRVPAWNSGSTHFTYTNAFRVNNRIFVPVYGTNYKPGGNSSYNSRDTQAMQAWQAAAGPGVEIIPIQCLQIIPSAGAIHCIVKQVPRYTGTSPAVNILSPAGGEILTASEPFKLEWSAIDTNNVKPDEINIYVSYDNSRYRHIATASGDTTSYLWTPGDRITRSYSANIKIVATSLSGNSTSVISRPFSMTMGALHMYDFSSGAGVNKFAYGSQTGTWSNVNGNPFPVTAQLSSANYQRLAFSDATGGTTDPNRYIAPTPSPISSESTHLFTFQLSSPISEMAQLEVLWEGFAAFCTQVELYVWDRVAQNWGDGTGRSGMNRYMDSWAGNIDGFLTGAIRSDFSRYVDQNRVIRFLVYTDRPGAVGSTGQGIGTYHDYMQVKVKEIDRRMA